MTTTSETSRRCPRCGSNRSLPYVYGLPAPGAGEQARRGEILLGGCIVDQSLPTHFCLACRHRFGRLREFGLDPREALLLRELDALEDVD